MVERKTTKHSAFSVSNEIAVTVKKGPEIAAKNHRGMGDLIKLLDDRDFLEKHRMSSVVTGFEHRTTPSPKSIPEAAGWYYYGDDKSFTHITEKRALDGSIHWTNIIRVHEGAIRTTVDGQPEPVLVCIDHTGNFVGLELYPEVLSDTPNTRVLLDSSAALEVAHAPEGSETRERKWRKLLGKGK